MPIPIPPFVFPPASPLVPYLQYVDLAGAGDTALIDFAAIDMLMASISIANYGPNTVFMQINNDVVPTAGDVAGKTGIIPIVMGTPYSLENVKIYTLGFYLGGGAAQIAISALQRSGPTDGGVGG